MFRLLIVLFLLSGCASSTLDKNIQQSIEIIQGLVKVHDTAQESITHIQQFCADLYPELSEHKKAQKRLEDFCDQSDRLFDELQRIEEQFLTSSEG